MTESQISQIQKKSPIIRGLIFQAFWWLHSIVGSENYPQSRTIKFKTFCYTFFKRILVFIWACNLNLILCCLTFEFWTNQLIWQTEGLRMTSSAQAISITRTESSTCTYRLLLTHCFNPEKNCCELWS